VQKFSDRDVFPGVANRQISCFLFHIIRNVTIKYRVLHKKFENIRINHSYLSSLLGNGSQEQRQLGEERVFFGMHGERDVKPFKELSIFIYKAIQKMRYRNI
jgi:hypothetical protein